jgi:hypothetical protein
MFRSSVEVKLAVTSCARSQEKNAEGGFRPDEPAQIARANSLNY